MSDNYKPNYLSMSKAEFKDMLERRRIEGINLSVRHALSQDSTDIALKNFIKWDNYNVEFLKHAFISENNLYKKEYINRSFFSDKVDPYNIVYNKFKEKIDYLEELSKSAHLLNTDIDDTSKTKSKLTNILSTKDIFIVHGHNTEIKLEVARTLEKVDLNPIILHEQPNQGKTLLEKFESNSNVGFAIILLTNDDIGKSKVDIDFKDRARQNVILELGYFMGKLNRNRILALYTHGIELPNDILGLAYIQIDNVGHWKYEMIRELKSAGYSVDSNKLY